MSKTFSVNGSFLRYVQTIARNESGFLREQIVDAGHRFGELPRNDEIRVMLERFNQLTNVEDMVAEVLDERQTSVHSMDRMFYSELYTKACSYEMHLCLHMQNDIPYRSELWDLYSQLLDAVDFQTELFYRAGSTAKSMREP